MGSANSLVTPFKNPSFPFTDLSWAALEPPTQVVEPAALRAAAASSTGRLLVKPDADGEGTRAGFLLVKTGLTDAVDVPKDGKRRCCWEGDGPEGKDNRVIAGFARSCGTALRRGVALS